jgi:hypothetical protein
MFKFACSIIPLTGLVVAVCIGLPLSVARIVYLNATAAVGVPDTLPVESSSVVPAGGVPSATEYL